MRKIGLLSATSVIALAGSLAASPAQAFDNVHWNWTNNVYEDINMRVDIDPDFIISGLTEVERIQIKAGNLTAYADASYTTVAGGSGHGYNAPITINQYNVAYVDQDAAAAAAAAAAASGGESLTVSGDIDVRGRNQGGVDVGGGGDAEAAALAAALAANKSDVDQYNIAIVDLGKYGKDYKPMDAKTELAKIEVAATAAANIATIDSAFMTKFHDGQYTFGDYRMVKADDYGDQPLVEAGMSAEYLSYFVGWDKKNDMYGSSGNVMHDLAYLYNADAQFGLIDKAYISAYANGSHISGASIDVSATAAANIHTVDVTTTKAPKLVKDGEYGCGWFYCFDKSPEIATDNVVIGDLTQFAYADVNAYATGRNLYIGGYNNMGNMTVSKVAATAVGNVSSVTNKVWKP